ncbi:MAG: hypothetical protein RJA70_3710 [Pseudomonadota bacterium]|jgi:hypothetical protein
MPADESTGIPAAVPSDTQDVRAALLTATQLWRGGDFADALRWLRRAAESAADGNDDQRSLELARAAADLRNQSGVHNSTPPGADLDSPAESTFHNPAQTVPATPAAAATAALQAASRAARIAAGETAEDIERQRLGDEEPAVALSSASRSESAPSLGPGFQTHHAVRVALSPGPNLDGQFAVHPLAQGEQAPEGWNEALLVSVVSGKRLFPGRS